VKHEFELKIQAWVDGELGPAESEKMALWARSEPEASRLAEELRLTRQLMADNEAEVVVPESREFYWSKIERRIQWEAAKAPAVAVPWFVRGWRLLAPLAGVAAMAAGVVFALNQWRPSNNADVVSATAEGMETLTFHDQAAGMTVVWLQDNQDAQSAQISDDSGDDAGTSDFQM